MLNTCEKRLQSFPRVTGLQCDIRKTWLVSSNDGPGATVTMKLHEQHQHGHIRSYVSNRFSKNRNKQRKQAGSKVSLVISVRLSTITSLFNIEQNKKRHANKLQYELDEIKTTKLPCRDDTQQYPVFSFSLGTVLLEKKPCWTLLLPGVMDSRSGNTTTNHTSTYIITLSNTVLPLKTL